MVSGGVSRRFGREVIVDASVGGTSVDVERTVAANCFYGCEGWEQVSFGNVLSISGDDKYKIGDSLPSSNLVVVKTSDYLT